ncbi:MAG TPA: nucleotide exchange factor GrpE [Firmicutes bacterium]|nr:nucleotide exchange factor GrpE [Bacillota bacterium]
MTARKRKMEDRAKVQVPEAAEGKKDSQHKKKKGKKVKAENRGAKKEEQKRAAEETKEGKAAPEDLTEEAVWESKEKEAAPEKEIPSDQEREINDLRQKNEELLNQLKRKQADIDNLRRIAKAEQAEMREYALHEFLCRLLPVLDNLERGLESARKDQSVPASYIEGLEMIHQQLFQLLEQEGVSTIEAVGTPFDPNCHHAVMQVESDQGEPGTVLEEFQKGYKHRSRILRPSMVKVCRD